MPFWTYIVASGRNGTIYTGHTENIVYRAEQHHESELGRFSSKYRCTRLVWYEEHETRDSAFRRERSIKEWRRSWKLMLIEEKNPTWKDLYKEVRDKYQGVAPYDLGPGIRRDERRE